MPGRGHRCTTADASVTTEPGIACTVQVADCLPVLFAAPGGRGVAAAHAGWRGLAAGVLEATVAALCEAAGLPARRDSTPGSASASGRAPSRSAPTCSRPSARGRRQPDRRPFRAGAAGQVAGRPRRPGARPPAGGRCRAGQRRRRCACRDPSRFFSYRRDRVTGRMAAAVWIAPRRDRRLSRARRGGGRAGAPACRAGRARCRAAARRREGR